MKNVFGYEIEDFSKFHKIKYDLEKEMNFYHATIGMHSKYAFWNVYPRFFFVEFNNSFQNLGIEKIAEIIAFILVTREEIGGNSIYFEKWAKINKEALYIKDLSFLWDIGSSQGTETLKNEWFDWCEKNENYKGK